MKKYLPEFMMGTAVLHTVIGVLLGQSQLQAIATSRFYNAIDPHFDRMAIFWFLYFGLMLFLMGAMVKWMQKITHKLPRWLPWVFWGMGTFSVLLMPVSGFWLLFPMGWMAYQQDSEQYVASNET